MITDPEVPDDATASGAVPSAVPAPAPAPGAQQPVAPPEPPDAPPAGAMNNPLDVPERAASEFAAPEEFTAAPGSAGVEPTHDPEPGFDSAMVEQLRGDVSGLTERLVAAERRADEMAAIARRQSEMVDELHRENRTLRDGEIREAVAPLVRGLARLSDDLARMRSGESADSADLTFLDGRVAELLHDCGVVPERPELGAAFDPQVHQATGSATTDDPDANRTIAELRRAGLRRDDGRMLRPADVVVYRYVAAASPPPAEPVAAGPDAGGSDDSIIEEEVA